MIENLVIFLHTCRACRILFMTMLLLLLLATLSATVSALSRPPAPILASRGSNQLVLYAKSLKKIIRHNCFSSSCKLTTRRGNGSLPTCKLLCPRCLEQQSHSLLTDFSQTTNTGSASAQQVRENILPSSEAVTTLPSAPGVPGDLRVASSSSDSIELKWSPPLDSTAEEAPIDSYNVQYRIANNENDNVWIDTRPVSSVESPRKKEIQLVSTTIDANANMSSAFFWLRASVGPSDVPSDQSPDQSPGMRPQKNSNEHLRRLKALDQLESG